MKLKYLVIVSLILAIITIGAASASNVADDISISDDAADEAISANEEDPSENDEIEVFVEEYDEDDKEPVIDTSDNSSQIAEIVNVPQSSEGNVSVFAGEDESEKLMEKSINDLTGTQDENGNIAYKITLGDLTRTITESELFLTVKFIGTDGTLIDSDNGTVKFADKSIEETDEEPIDEIDVDDFYMEHEKSIANNSQDYAISLYNYAGDGNLTVYVGDSATPIYNKTFNYCDIADFNLTDLQIVQPGDYKILLKFLSTSGKELTLLDYTLKVTDNEGYAGINADINRYLNVNPIEDSTGYIVYYYLSDGVDLDGNILVYVDNRLYYNKTIEYSNGIYLEDLNETLSIAEHFVQVKFFDGENTTLVKSKYVSIGYSICIEEYYDDSEPIVYVNQDKSLKVYLPKDATGDLYVIFDGNETKLNYKDGFANYTIMTSNLNIGKFYSLSVELRNDSKYPLKTVNYEVEVDFDVDYPDEISIGENEVISLNLPSSYSGVFNLYSTIYDSDAEERVIDKKIASVNVVKGKANISLSNLPEGDLCLIAEYDDGDDTFKRRAYINVRKNNESVFVSVQPETIEVGDSVVVNITGPKTLNQYFEIYVDGSKVHEINIFNLGEMTYSVNFTTMGNHTIRVYTTDEMSEGDVFYSNTFTVNVNEKQSLIDPALTISVANITEGDAAVVSVTTNKTFNGKVLVQIGGSNYTVDVVNGTGSVNVTGLSAATYTAIAKFNATSVFAASTKNATFVVKAKEVVPPTLIDPALTISVANITEGDAAVVSVTTNKTFSGKVLVQIGSSNYTVDVVNGTGSVNVTGLSAATYIAIAKFNATSVFAASTKNATFIVNAKSVTPTKVVKLTLKKVKVKKSAKKLFIKAKLKINGKAVKGKKLKFKFNKKSYKAKTNKKGIAKIKIKKKVLKKLKVGKKVKYQVSYGKNTVKRTVKVKK